MTWGKLPQKVNRQHGLDGLFCLFDRSKIGETVTELSSHAAYLVSFMIL